MRNYIILNGQNSNNINGLLIQSLPPITKPLMRTQVEEIDGRDGDIVTKLGFSAYNKEFTVGLYGNYDVDEVIGYFNSEGVVTFSNEPDKYYKYQILEQIDFEKLIRFKTATVKMHCQPFKYAAFEGNHILDPSADNLMTIPNFSNTTNGVTLTASDGTVSIKGKATTATEFYLPITSLSLSAGSYELSATSSGTNPNYCSIRLIGSTPSDIDSFGSKYVKLEEGTVTLDGTLSASKTFSYLWFYITAGQNLDFSVTFEFENQAQKVVSGVGSSLMLLDTAEAPFTRFDIKGDAYQQMYSGKNLLNISLTTNSSQGITATNNGDGTIKVTGTSLAVGSISISPVSVGSLVLENGKSYTQRFEIVSGVLPDGVSVVPAFRDSGGTVHYSYFRNNSTVTTDSEMTCASYNLYWGAAGKECDFTFRVWLEEGSNLSSDYEPYVGGVPSPNQNYPQKIQAVTHQDMIRLTGKNLVNADELYLSASVERTSDGFRAIITSGTLATYYSGSISNPIGVYTISFDARVANADEATLVFRNDAFIWGYTNLTLKDKNGNPADESYRTLSAEWKRYNFTVVANSSQPWIASKAMHLYFSTYTNSPIFELRNLQVEAGNVATGFDISRIQMYPINFRTGKNMLSVDFLSTGGLYLGAPTAEKYRVNNAFSPIKVSPNTTYTISANLGTTVQGMRVDVQECNINAIFILDLGWKQLANGAYTFTTGSTTEYIKMGFSLSTTSATVTTDSTENTTVFNTAQEWLRGATLQVEAGGTATTYEPYEAIELCKIGDYQDYLSKSGEDWYVHKEIGILSLNGSETWSATKMTNSWLYYTIVSGFITTEASQLPNIYSNYFIQDASNNQWASALGVSSIATNDSASPNTQLRVTVGDSTNALATFKTWLGNNTPSIYHPLATPTDTKITSEETIAQLNALKNNVHAYKGVTYISSIPGGSTALPPILSVEVAKSSDGIVTNAGNFPAKPKLTIYGAGNIGVYLNGNQIFQIALGDEEHITIDTATMEAYQDSLENLKNRLVVGDYDNFILNPGENTISFSGSVTKCIVENYSRWL